MVLGEEADELWHSYRHMAWILGAARHSELWLSIFPKSWEFPVKEQFLPVLLCENLGRLKRDLEIIHKCLDVDSHILSSWFPMVTLVVCLIHSHVLILSSNLFPFPGHVRSERAGGPGRTRLEPEGATRGWGSSCFFMGKSCVL